MSKRAYPVRPESCVMVIANDHGFCAMLGDKDLARVTCLARSDDGQRPWFALRVQCMNGDRYEVVATQRKSTLKHPKQPTKGAKKK